MFGISLELIYEV